MKKSPTLIPGLMTSLLVMGISTVGYADSATAPKAPANKASDGPARIADKDFGRLSADGVNAFNDVHMARRAIFDGQTDEAATLVADAKASLAKAKTDDAILMKAESALRGRGQVMSNTPARRRSPGYLSIARSRSARPSCPRRTTPPPW